MLRIYHLLLLLLGLGLLSTTAQTTPEHSKPLKVLAIGNSFSDDAVEHYLYDLAKAGNKSIIIGNMYIGGAAIELHVRNIHQDKAVYSYRKIQQDGQKVVTPDVSIKQALKDEHWDYISLQQASPFSGKYDIIMEGLPELIDYVKANSNPDVKIIYHQTWAYQQDSEHKRFVDYNKDQNEMYSAIASATKKIAHIKDIDLLIPAGTAIQNARSSTIGDKLTRDGYHLDLGYGRLTAASTWFEILFKEDVRNNPYQPDSITPLEAKIAKEAAHKAVKKPFKVSEIKL